MKNLSLYIFLSLLLLLTGCEKEAELQFKEYPYVVTKEPELRAEGAKFTADLLNPGTQEILRYGFVWSEKLNPTTEDHKKLFEGSTSTGIYTYDITNSLAKGQGYHVRAYVETASYKVYGNDIHFISEGSLPPVITAVSPAFGSVGSAVQLSGQNFSASLAGNTVLFGKLKATIDSVTENSIYAKVPAVTKPENLTIAVTTAAGTGAFVTPFEVWFPWQQKAGFPGLYFRGTNSFELNGKIYVVGGIMEHTITLMREVWEYDPATNKWTRKPDFPGTARRDATAFAVNGKGYYGLGSKYSYDKKDYLPDFWEFDPVTAQWTRKTDFPGTPVIFGRSFTVKDKAYLGPGYYWDTYGQTFVSDFWEYDPQQNSWGKKQSFPGSKRYVGLAMGAPDRGYMGVGSTGWPQTDFYEYNPQSDTWKLAGHYPGKGFNNIAGFYINNKLYMGLGSDNSSNTFSDIWEFDPVTGSWKELNSSPAKISASLSHTIKNKGYADNGRIMYEFDPVRN